MNALASIAIACGLAAVTLSTDPPRNESTVKDEPVQLGNFSVSLAVKDIEASKAFYEKLDFGLRAVGLAKIGCNCSTI